MTITGGSALPKDDIERMMRDAQDHADEDQQRARGRGDPQPGRALQWQTEKFLAESGDKLPEDSQDEINEALGDLRGALGGSDIERIKTAHENAGPGRPSRPARCSTRSSADGTRRRAGAGRRRRRLGAAGAGRRGGGDDVRGRRDRDEDDKK